MYLNNIPDAGVEARRTEGILSAAGQLQERTPIQSPARLRRALTVEETDEIKALVKSLRYQEGRDDSYFFTLAQAAQVEAKKIVKMGALKNKK